MKSRKGFTLIELLVVGFIGLIVIGGIVAVVSVCVFAVKGVDAIDTVIDEAAAARTVRLESNPPLYKVGDIVYHKATDAKMIVAKNSCSWNEVKEGWNIKVKDGGYLDKVGGFGINEKEVKLSLKEIGR